MKTILAVAAVFLLFTSITAIAATRSVKGKSVITGVASGGFSSAGGYIPSEMTADPGFSRSVGACYGYGVLDRLMLQCGNDFVRKPLILKSETSLTTDTISLNFVDFYGGGRWFFNSFYTDGGLFYGQRVLTQQIKSETAGVSTMKTVPDRCTHSDAGIYIGTGYLFRIKKNVKFDLGCRFEYGIPYVYNQGRLNLQTRNLSIRAGIAYTIE